ncbi:NAD(P)/FAD-dependent oxidoreductase [Actinomadura sp. KC216]|uniref:NAD(P)/FAD-dependent oxidoreductase n=1 Tax=Actinomadura sp. KC216 TaxID=2530370 RepID=UPI001044EEEB|nr:NAD(P)/FAD-dependent oxidoreductase [Actinomadura sp. KC216]TDB91946.1 NAD(P)/FAD-dependent oxidoreductase [Actinomadura sp. KC216]
MTDTSSHEFDHDVIIIGAGAAGLNAALVLGRARRRVAVIDAGMSRHAPVEHTYGYLSRDGICPDALRRLGSTEVAGYGVKLIEAAVERVEPEFLVHLTGGPVLTARRVLVAAGLRDMLPDIPGVRECWGKDLVHCPYSHGWEVADRPVGVLGGHPDAVELAQLVRQWSADVTFFRHTGTLSEYELESLTARGIRVLDGEVRRLVVERGRLQGVELAAGAVFRRATLFVCPWPVPRDELLVQLGCLTGDNGRVVTDGTGQTSVPGVWAAGSVVDPLALMVTAAGQGAATATAINLDLVQEDVVRALVSHRIASSPFSL